MLSIPMLRRWATAAIATRRVTHRRGWLRTTLALLLPLALSVTAMRTLATENANRPHAPATLPDTPAAALLEKWIRANNSGDPEQVRQFIQASYSPALLKKIRIEDHLEFYTDGYADFGRLDPKRFVIKQTAPNSLSIYLMRLDIPDEDKLKPENIIVVDVDVDAGDPHHLARAIGFGSLLCAIREGRAAP